MLDDWAWAARGDLLSWDLHALVLDIQDPLRTPADSRILQRRARTWRRDFARIGRQRRELLARVPSHPHPSDIEDANQWEACGQALLPLWKRLERRPMADDWQCTLHLRLQDYHAAGRLRVEVIAGRQRIVIVDDQCLKPRSRLADHIGGDYTVRIPFTCGTTPRSLRIEGWGYGGQGIAYVEMINPTLTLAPSHILRVTGPVSHAESVLRDDSAYAMLGDPNVLAAMHEPKRANKRGIMEIALHRL